MSMSTRQSPTASATTFSIGAKRTGNDGNKWIVKAASNGVKRWTRISKKVKSNVKSKIKVKSKSKSKVKSKSNVKSKSKVKSKVKSKSKKVRARITRGSWKTRVLRRQKQLANKSSTKSYYDRSKINSKRTYLIHYNGGRPWKVIVSKNLIEILAHKDIDSVADTIAHKYDKKVWSTKKFVGYWNGFDPSPYEIHGNTLLVLLEESARSAKYVYIGSHIISFKTTEKIKDYYSNMGNNDVPYPIAVTHSKVILLAEDVIVDNKVFTFPITVANSEWIYSIYYGHGTYDPSKNQMVYKNSITKTKSMEKAAKKLVFKTLVKIKW
jgi:hypothetical protein